MKHTLSQLLILILILVGMAPFKTEAEVFPLSGADINVETVPANPEPYNDVTVTISSYSTNLNKAKIEWKSGDQTVLSGTGRTKYTFKAGGPNTNTSINVLITPEGGNQITKNIIIRPSEVDLLWQAVNSYTPPFYKGKAFPTSESTIKVVAVPNTQGVVGGNNKNMEYSWKLEYMNVADASGYGKDSFTFKNDYLRNEEKIGVVISSVGSDYRAESNLTIPINNPEVVFYKKSLSDGINYASSLETETFMEEDEMTLVAEPYFSTININSNDFIYNWKINNNEIITPRNPRELTVRPSGRGGYATINFNLESASKLFQSTGKALRINL